MNIETMLRVGAQKSPEQRANEAATLLLEDPRSSSLIAELWGIRDKFVERVSDPQYAPSHGGLAHGAGSLFVFKLITQHLNALMLPKNHE